MNDKEWKKLNEHLKNKFWNNEKIEELESFPNKNMISNLEDNKIYKLQFSCIAVDIIDSKNKLNYFEYDEWSSVLSEFAYGVSKIMNIYNVKYIRIQGDSVYGIFDTSTKEEVSKILDCCAELNTFKVHLNKQIHKSLSGGDNGDEEKVVLIDYGIGAWLSFDNFISIVGVSKKRDVVFIGDAVNYANTLSKLAGRNNFEPILINQLMLNNIDKDYKKINKDIWDFKEYKNIHENEKVYGFDWIFTKYLNWIKNNS